MPQIFTHPFFITAVSVVAAIIFTYLVRGFARQRGIVAAPKADRWHKKPTAMLGGLAIFLATLLMYGLFVPKTSESMVILAGSSLLFLVGLIDDIRNIKPYQKLIGQIIGVAVVIGFGLVLPWTSSEIFNIAITAFWLIGITNAINLLDNMDGLAAGISAIAALSLAVGFSANGQSNDLLLVAVFIGALLGFLIYNFNPASIFMGDCGSMFVGFFLASSVLLTQVGGRSRSVISVLAVPALTLFVPIFDTTFVTVLRKLWGRKASQGGRDHTSHRLVALGITERNAVLMLYGLAFLAGIISIFIRDLPTTQSLAMIGFFVIVLTIIGVYLSKVKVYAEQEEDIALQNRAAFGFLLNLSHKRRVFEVILDAILITLAYYSSYLLVFGAFEESANWNLFIKSLPILIVLNLFSFLIVGVYRGIWRYTGIQDFVTFLKGVVLGSVLSILAILLLYRFQYFSRTIFMVNSLLLFSAVAGSRIAFRLFRQIVPNSDLQNGRRILIYGAGDGGEMILRELKNNPQWNYTPVGFVDDDPLKKNKVIHGFRVFGGNGSLHSICRENDVREIIISFRIISPERLDEIRNLCREKEIILKRALLKIEPFDYD